MANIGNTFRFTEDDDPSEGGLPANFAERYSLRLPLTTSGDHPSTWGYQMPIIRLCMNHPRMGYIVLGYIMPRVADTFDDASGEAEAAVPSAAAQAGQDGTAGANPRSAFDDSYGWDLGAPKSESDSSWADRTFREPVVPEQLWQSVNASEHSDINGVFDDAEHARHVANFLADPHTVATASPAAAHFNQDASGGTDKRLGPDQEYGPAIRAEMAREVASYLADDKQATEEEAWAAINYRWQGGHDRLAGLHQLKFENPDFRGVFSDNEYLNYLDEFLKAPPPRLATLLADPHTALGAASFAPGLIGSAASAIDGLLYAYQGDPLNASIALGAAMAGIVSDAGIARLAAKGLKEGAEAVNEAGHAAKAAEEEGKLAAKGGAEGAVTPPALAPKPSEVAPEPTPVNPGDHGRAGDHATTEVAGPGPRPTWRASEQDVGELLEGQGYRPQVSFRDTVEVRRGTKGSSRPDYHRPGSSVEVKNYDLTTARGRYDLIRNVSRQATDRAKGLPVGTSQNIYIDLRGQTISRAIRDDLVKGIVEGSNGAISANSINFLR